MFIFLFFGSCFYLILGHLVPHATDIGISEGEAATVFSLMGLASIVGRILMGAISDRISRKLAAIICALLQAGAMLWLIWSRDLWMLYLFALVYGFANAGMGPIVWAITSDVFGLGKIGVIVGVLDIGRGVGAAIGPIVGGLIFDISNDYSMAFLLGAAAMFATALLIAIIGREKDRITDQSYMGASNDN